MRRSSSEAPARGVGEVGLLDEELYRLARGAGRLRLRIGQALHRLGDGVHELGFSTLGAYALERCSRGGRWAAESRALARRLESLPQLTAALETGSIGWSMAELLARHATQQTEAALLEIARGRTVQSMRVALCTQESPGPADDDALARTLSLTVPLEEAWALEATRMMIEHMDGKPGGGHWLESLLAEGYGSLLELVDPGQNDMLAQMDDQAMAWRAEMRELEHLHAEAELQSRPVIDMRPHAGEAPEVDDLPIGLEALDARIRHYSAELASRDLFFGQVAERFLALRGWEALGFVSEAHYARERLGMSRASLRSKVSLARPKPSARTRRRCASARPHWLRSSSARGPHRDRRHRAGLGRPRRASHLQALARGGAGRGNSRPPRRRNGSLTAERSAHRTDASARALDSQRRALAKRSPRWRARSQAR